MAQDIKCDWRMFIADNKDCLVCDIYEKCRSDKNKHDPEYIKRQIFMTDGVIEDDAKEAAALIRELDRLDDELSLSKLGLALQGNSDEEVDDKPKKITKTEQMLTPILKFLESENIPFFYEEPSDIYVSNFMMITYRQGFIIRLTSLNGVPKDEKFISQPFRSEKKRLYKYVKKGEFDTIFPIIRSVVFFRKTKSA